MFKSISTLLFVFCAIVFSYSQTDALQNVRYNTQIASIKMELSGWEVSYPVIELGSEQTIGLNFDYLSESAETFNYKIIHCNADWTPSSLHENEYLNGFFENQFDMPKESFNTFIKYQHYSVNLPNDMVQFKVSGNYIIKVYQDFDQSQLLFTQRFSVYENKAGISASAKRSILAKYRSSHQQVDFQVNTSALSLTDPYNDVKIAVVPNNIWTLAKTDLQAQFVRDGALIFENTEDNAYQGYNEFRVFNMQSLKYLQERVAKIFFEDQVYYVRLMDDDERRFKVYLNEKDINGAYVIRNRETDDDILESDYAQVYFYLPMPEPLTDGKVYVVGELNNFRTDESNRMVYNYEKKAYQLMIKLKQGYYNYEYVWVDDKTGEWDVARFEGSHHETENNYLIYVYARTFGDEYDRLVGFSIVNNSSPEQLKNSYY